ncbi:hypothetical protein DIURU_000291 [Diutina rugosa]|uniref:Pre-mRNA-splicing factor CWC21 n=1 Tax=Diutina rugosa TaxID=5481 RepID=A0A642UYM3_DIURU|nr:uncharacterized protein DIURU_000291 [Diutina rugosa]KAA8908070.1 hypothetical protein DIURU_000291 [Diutina rugosa]
MSYNGIGLQSARGSGTSGHIQTNLAHPGDHDHHPYEARQQSAARHRKHQTAAAHHHKQQQARDRLRDEHAAKRALEVRCAELRDELEDASEDEAVITAKVAELRAQLIKEYDVVDYVPLKRRRRQPSETETTHPPHPSKTETHQPHPSRTESSHPPPPSPPDGEADSDHDSSSSAAEDAATVTEVLLNLAKKDQAKDKYAT